MQHSLGTETLKPGKQIEWNRIAALVATVAVLFFFTRSAPFPSTTFWELTLARDFDLAVGWVIMPETISLAIANSSVSLLGLKAIYHIFYFFLCCILCLWVFKAREIFPGVMALAIFALSMQSFLSLRMLLQLIFVVSLLTMLSNNQLKNNFGILLIPVTAAASALSLNAWLLIALVACHAFINEDYSLTLILCALTGLLFFPEGAAISVDPNSVLSWNLASTADINALYMLAGIYLLVNLLNLGRLTHEDLPDLIFYAITGFMALISASNLPIFIAVGVIICFKSFANAKPMPLAWHLVGIVVLTALIHLFLFVNPFGFKLNPSVRGQLGKNLAPFLEGYIDHQEIYNHEIGELVWKGLVSIENSDLPIIYNSPRWMLTRADNGGYTISPLVRQPDHPSKVEVSVTGSELE